MLFIRCLFVCSMILFSFYSWHTCFANEQVDAFINKQMKEQNIPGLGLLVMENGKIVKNQGYGFSNLELQTPVTPDSVFQIASAGKQFTALAILKLIETGKIASLDDSIDKYLGNSLPPNWKEITIRQLLSHTSGIPNSPSDLDFQKNYTEDQLLKLITKDKLAFQPGAKWMYSNGGYMLLGIIIHKVSGEFYWDYLQQIAFKPLDMTSTRVNILEDIIPNRAAGYELIDNQVKNQGWISPTLSVTADGSIVTTLNDLAKWNNALDQQKIINKELYQALWTPIKLNDGSHFPYGFGWFIEDINGHKLIQHPGEFQGFRSEIARYPDDKLSVVVLINGNYADPIFIAHHVAGIYNPAVASKTYEPVKLDPALLDRYAGIYKSDEPPIEVDIQAKNNELIFTIGDKHISLLPYNETSFFDPHSVMTLTFEVDKNQKVVSMTYHKTAAIEMIFKRQNGQVSLIPRKLLFGNPEKTSAKISPDGLKLAYLAPNNQNILNVWVRELEKGQDSQVTSDNSRSIRQFIWQFDNEHILYMQDKDGDENWHIYQTEIGTPTTKDLTPFEGVKSEILAVDPRFPKELLFKTNKRDPSKVDVYRLDLKTGQSKPDTENPGDVIRWVADHNLQIRAALAYAADGSLIIRVRDKMTSPWRDLLKIDPNEIAPDDVLGVIDFSSDNQSIYLITSLGANTARLLKINITTGEQKVVAEDRRYDLTDLLLNPTTYALEAVGVEREHHDWIVLDPTLKQDFDFLFQKLKTDINIPSRDVSNLKWTVVSQSDVHPSQFFLFRRPKDLKFLFSSQPSLERYRLSSMQPISFEARDGLPLEGYLTLPVGLDPKNLPAVILVHGGPWLRDIWGFHPQVQWLANRGYAVLQINFRGSTGYGKKHLNAGFGEWANTMHHDILDGRSWLIEHGYADPKKIAIFGESYGGFETLVALAFSPDDFCCGVDVVGPSNLISLLKTLPADWASMKSFMERRIGKLEGNEEFLKTRSPLYKANQIKKPLLIAQGANDPRVKQAESDQIVEAMRRNHLPVEYLLFKDEGHGLVQQLNKMKFYAAAEAFLAKYLGGRQEPPTEEENWESLKH